MSIVPASRLSRCELALLGNNVRPVNRASSKRRRSRSRWVTAAVNRSLESVGESVSKLYPSLVAAR